LSGQSGIQNKVKFRIILCCPCASIVSEKSVYWMTTWDVMASAWFWPLSAFRWMSQRVLQ